MPIYPPPQFPDFQLIGMVLAFAAGGILCGFIGLALGLFSARVRVGCSLGFVAIAVGVVAPVLGLLLLWGQLESWCYAVPAAPIIPGVLAVTFARTRAQPRGFPITPGGAGIQGVGSR